MQTTSVFRILVCPRVKMFKSIIILIILPAVMRIIRVSVPHAGRASLIAKVERSECVLCTRKQNRHWTFSRLQKSEKKKKKNHTKKPPTPLGSNLTMATGFTVRPSIVLALYLINSMKIKLTKDWPLRTIHPDVIMNHVILQSLPNNTHDAVYSWNH